MNLVFPSITKTNYNAEISDISLNYLFKKYLFINFVVKYLKQKNIHCYKKLFSFLFKTKKELKDLFKYTQSTKKEKKYLKPKKQQKQNKTEEEKNIVIV